MTHGEIVRVGDIVYAHDYSSRRAVDLTDRAVRVIVEHERRERMSKKKNVVFLVWDAENNLIHAVAAEKADAEAKIEALLRQPGHDADKLHVVEAPSRH